MIMTRKFCFNSVYTTSVGSLGFLKKRPGMSELVFFEGIVGGLQNESRYPQPHIKKTTTHTHTCHHGHFTLEVIFKFYLMLCCVMVHKYKNRRVRGLLLL